MTRATIDDVAREAGVSTATVSRVINNSGTVSPKTAARVFAAIEALDYLPHTGARVLASNRTNRIGVIFPEISGAFFTMLLCGIEQAVYANGYTLLVYSTRGLGATAVPPISPLGPHNADGLIVFTNSLSDEELRRLDKRGFPMVLLHRSAPEGTAVPAVTFENKEGAYRMTEHLIADGYQRIAFLASGDDVEDSHWREIGYREAMAAHDLPIAPDWVQSVAFGGDGVATAVAHWLTREPPIEAIFCWDDDVARHCLATISQQGKIVPDDVAVVGFDDGILAQYLHPPLTTVRAPIEQAGQVAAQQLIHLIRNGHADPLTLLPVALVIRESCGCQKSNE